MTYNATTEGITAVDGVEVDITVRGDEDKAQKVLMDLKEHMGLLGYAFESEIPPDEIDDVPSEYMPIMSVAWDGVFNE